MKRIVFQPLYFIYALCTFILTVILFLPFIITISMINNISSRKIVFSIIRIWLKIWLTIIGMPVQTIGKMSPNRCVMIANHISYMDTLVLFPSTNNYFRILGNKEMSRIPLLSVIYKQIAILVDRSSPESRAKSFKLMFRVIRNNVSIFIFPEGKFNTSSGVLKPFYDGAFRLAISTQTPIQPIILPDTVNRWHYSGIWKFWPGKNRVIFLEPVSVEGMKLENLPLLKQKVFTLMEKELLKIKK